MTLLIIFFLGSVIGSFLTVVIDRLPQGKTFFRGRSQCDHCKHALSLSDLFPLLSYLFLKGKCRYCKKEISPHHFYQEIAVGLLFVIVYLATISTATLFTVVTLLELVYRLSIVSALFVIFLIDFRHRIIPFSLVLFCCIVTLLFLILTQPLSLPIHILSAIGVFGFFFIIHLATKGKGMGFGDVMFAFAMGFILGFPTVVVSLYVAFLTGSVIALILILGRRKTLKSTVPFGPFLVLGTVLGMLWQEPLTYSFLTLLRLQ